MKSSTGVLKVLGVYSNSNVLKPNSNKTYIFHNKKDKNIINKFKNKNAKLIFMKIENNSFDLNTILKKIYS